MCNAKGTIRKCILIFQRVKIDLLFTWFIGSQWKWEKASVLDAGVGVGVCVGVWAIFYSNKFVCIYF